MARLIYIRFTPHHEVIEGSTVHWVSSEGRPPIVGLPQIVWSDGTLFLEASIWAMHRARMKLVSHKTIASNLSKLLAYANYLESEGISLWHFPPRRDEQCLIRYRGYLIEKRSQGELSPSGATERMRTTIAFYRFLQAAGYLDRNKKLWQERSVQISTFDRTGFERMISVTSTDLAIPCRRRPGVTLEDGLMPLSDDAVTQLFSIIQLRLPYEFRLITALGVFCGLRIGTIADLKVTTLMQAAPDPIAPSNRIINVGPGASPPVATKFGVTGQVAVPEHLYNALLEYATSSVRLQRVALAATKYRDVLFLTARGNKYAEAGTDQSSAIRVLCHRVRAAAKEARISELQGFIFHQTRATFATRMAVAQLRKHSTNEVLAWLKRAMLHKSEDVTLRYIRFVQEKPLKQAAADAFTLDLLGIDR